MRYPEGKKTSFCSSSVVRTDRPDQDALSGPISFDSVLSSFNRGSTSSTRSESNCPSGVITKTAFAVGSRLNEKRHFPFLKAYASGLIVGKLLEDDSIRNEEHARCSFPRGAPTGHRTRCPFSRFARLHAVRDFFGGFDVPTRFVAASSGFLARPDFADSKLFFSASIRLMM
jgi:hypothetical protein